MPVSRWSSSAYNALQRLQLGEAVIDNGGNGTKLKNLLARVDVDVSEALAGMDVSTNLPLVEGLGTLGLEEVGNVDSHDDGV